MKDKILKQFFLLIFSVFTTKAQEIKNIDFTVKNNVITVTYDLVNCPRKEKYDVKLEIKLNGTSYFPKTITGDLKKIEEGKNKEIQWDVLKDKTELKGSLQAEIAILQTYSTEINGGPSNVFLSMLLPGLGNIQVNKYLQINPIFPWYYTSLAFLGAAAYGYHTKIQSDNYYSLYHSATTQTAMDENYKLANDNYQVFQAMIGVTASIYAFNIASVLIKGCVNRGNQKRSFTSIDNQLKWNIAATSTSFQIGLIKYF